MVPNQQKIIRRAFELWQQAGCPEGKDKDLCRQAERELRDRPQFFLPTKLTKPF